MSGMQTQTGYRLEPTEGDAIWFLGTLMTVKAGSAQTGGALTVLEQLMPAGFGPPPHIHLAEDEAFYLLEGGITVTCGDQTWRASPGSFVWLPRGIRHAFTVDDAAPARMLQITSPAGFEHFATEVGTPATAPVLPPPSPPDIDKLLAAAARRGYQILPPPAP